MAKGFQRIMKITSVNNDTVKFATKLQQRKFRDESGLFLLEGEKCIEEAISSGIEIENIFVSEDNCNVFHNEKIIEVTEPVLAKVSTTSTPPKVVAVAKQPKYKWSDKFKKVILLEDIKDAGNLGTILRSACAFDVDAIILYGDTVDLFNPKCVRSSVGNLWKIPVFSVSDFDWIKSKFQDFEKVATLPKNEQSIWLKDYIPKDKVLIMFGTESSGLSSNLKDFANQNITIEMSKKVESLNLSTSASIIMYKIFL